MERLRVYVIEESEEFVRGYVVRSAANGCWGVFVDAFVYKPIAHFNLEPFYSAFCYVRFWQSRVYLLEVT